MASKELLCEVRASLLIELSAVSMAHAKQAAMLSAVAACADHAGFSKMTEQCAETQGRYDAARDALKVHRQDHGC